MAVLIVANKHDNTTIEDLPGSSAVALSLTFA
jgi:hypothetical protein